MKIKLKYHQNICRPHLLRQDPLESLHVVAVVSCLSPGSEQKLQFTFLRILRDGGNKMGQLQSLCQTFPAIRNLLVGQEPLDEVLCEEHLWDPARQWKYKLTRVSLSY